MSTTSHSIPVIGVDGTPLTPTMPSKARKLVKGGQATGFWNKLDQYCLRLTVETRTGGLDAELGVDPGAKYDGYAVVCGNENLLNIKVDLPDKEKIVRKIAERRQLRRARRSRTCRRRPQRFSNRRRSPGWIAPSQLVLVQVRLKVLTVLCDTYPITNVGLEDVAFDHGAHRYGKHFSTAEIGKARVRALLEERGTLVARFRGYETKALREGYGYRKSSSKKADRFEAHCSDALALALAVRRDAYLAPGPLVVIDDRYRAVRRRLHDTQPAPGGLRAPYSRGVVFGLRKGLMIGTPRGKVGQLCGALKGGYRYYDTDGKRQSTTRVAWVSTHLYNKKEGPHSPAP